MKKILFLIAAILFVGYVNAQSASNLQKEIQTKAKKIEQKVIDWRRDIHQHPELGNREVRTAAIVAKHLRSLGIEVQTDVAVTGVVGILKGKLPGPVVALRADMDALPILEKTDVPFASKVTTTYNGKETSVMHACGHDAHTAILMGVAEILSGMKDKIKGTVKFIFQPAEEGHPIGEEGGAKLMVKEGVLDNPKVDVIFALHEDAWLEVGKIAYRPGSIQAGATNFKITVKGKSGTSANPWSLVDPIVTSAQIVNNLQTIVSRKINLTENPAVLSIASIHGGNENRSNIIPEQVEILGEMRVFSDADKITIIEHINLIVTKTAEANDAAVEIEVPFTADLPATINNKNLTEKMLPTLQRTVGESNTILVPTKTNSEDFSYFANEIPALYYRIGGLPKGKDPKTAAPHHSPDFYIDESGFITGVNATVNLVIDYMEIE